MSKYNKISNVMEMGLRVDRGKRGRDGSRSGRGKSDCTMREYRYEIDLYCRWVAEREGTQRIPYDRYHGLIQDYVADMVDRGLSPYTIHKRLSALCAATHERMEDYQHPRRGRPAKGRYERPERYHTRAKDRERVREIAGHIGIRRAELCDLRGRDLIERDGHLYVHVRAGKGGKEHDQLILPAHDDAVRGIFAPCGPDEYVLTRDQARASAEASTHAERRAIAREAYDWYIALPEREREDVWRPWMRDRLLDKWERRQDRDRLSDRDVRDRARAEWEREWASIRERPVRQCRGANRAELIRQGRDPQYDREAVYFVSLAVLSHYREDVTVTHYLI